MKFCYLSLALVCLSVPAFAQNYSTIFATSLKDATGASLTGQVCFTPSATWTVGGTSGSVQICGTVTSGAINAANLIPNASVATPPGLTWRVDFNRSGTTFLSLYNVVVYGATYQLDNLSATPTQRASGTSTPTIACSYGSTYTQTDGVSGQNLWTCTNVDGIPTWYLNPPQINGVGGTGGGTGGTGFSGGNLLTFTLSSSPSAGITETSSDTLKFGNGTSGDSSASLTAGSLALSGALTSNSVSTGGVTDSGALSAASVTTSGAVSAGTVSATTLTGAFSGNGSALQYLPYAANVKDFTWTTNPGSSLSASALATVTFTKCPFSAADSPGVPIFISGGTGAAEVSTVTGGTCTYGSSGTIQFTPANAHSGVYGIRSATNGCQEAVNHSNAGMIWYPVGAYDQWATCTINADDVTIAGAGPGVSTISVHGPSATAFTVTGPPSLRNYVTIKGLAVVGDQSGGVTTMSGGWCVDSTQTNHLVIRDMNCIFTFNGFRMNTAAYGEIHDSFVINYGAGTGVGFLLGPQSSNTVLVDDLVTAGGGSAPRAGIEAQGVGLLILTNSDLQGSGNSLLIDPPTGVAAASVDVGTGNYFDHSGFCGICLLPAGGNIVRFRASSFWATQAGSFGVLIDTSGGGGVLGATLLGAQVYDNGSNGIYINSSAAGTIQNVTISGSTIASNQGAGISANGPNSYLQITGNKFGNSLDGFGTGQSVGVFLSAYAMSDMNIGNNIFDSSLTPVSDASTSTRKRVENNEGIDNVIPSLASATTLNIGNAPNRVLQITGTTALQNLTMAAIPSGKVVTLQFTTASPGGVTTGGNFAAAVSLTQNQSTTCTYLSDSKWHCSAAY